MKYAHGYHKTTDSIELKQATPQQLSISEVHLKGMKQDSFMGLRETFLPKSLIILKGYASIIST